MNELNFQKALLDALRAEGGWGYKASHRMLAGIPDLVCLLDGRWAMIECKQVSYKKEPEFNHTITIKTTPLQRRTLNAVRSCKGVAGVATLIDINPTKYIFVSSPDRTFCTWGRDDFIRKKRGEPWPIREIMRSL